MSKCFCFPWHSDLSCAPHHAFLLLSPEKDFMVPLVECQERWHFTVKMCREIFYWRSIKKYLEELQGRKSSFVSFSLLFFFFFFWLTEILFGSSGILEKFCQETEMAYKLWEVFVPPSPKYAPNATRIWRQLLVSRLGQPRDRVIRQTCGYSDRLSHLPLFSLFSPEMSVLKSPVFPSLALHWHCDR